MATLQEKIAALIAETREGTVTPERLGGLLQELYDMAKEVSTIDSELSDTSTRPLQNKVVTAALNNKADITYVATAIANAITNTLNTAV